MAYCCDGSLVAYSLAYFTEYGTAYVDKCFVCSGYRGHGFQYLLLNANIAKLVSNGAQEIFAMTSPKNEASIKVSPMSGSHSNEIRNTKEPERIILKWEL